MDNQTFMGLVIAGGIVILLLQNKEDKLEKPTKPDIAGPDIDMGFAPPIQYRTDLLKAYRGWKVAAGELVREYDLNMRKIIMWGTAHPDLDIEQMRSGYPQFESMFPAYGRQFKDLLQQGEAIMTECNKIQDHGDPAYLGHTEIQMELAPLAERYRTLEDFWDMLNRRFREQKTKSYTDTYGKVNDKFSHEMDLTGVDYVKDDDFDFFQKKPTATETFLDSTPKGPSLGKVKPAFSATPVRTDNAEDTRNFSSPASNVTAIPTLDGNSFNTTNAPLQHAAKPELTMDAEDKAPVKPTTMVKARPGRPEGPGLEGFVQGNLPSHRIRADESLADSPLTEAMIRNMNPQEAGAAVRELNKRQAKERGAMGMIDYKGNTFTLPELEEYINRLDRNSYQVPTNVDIAVQDYDALSDAVNTLDGIIAQDTMAGGRFSVEEARAVKMIASAAMARYEKMIHDNFNVSLKKRGDKPTFPSEWKEKELDTKRAKFGTPGSG